MAYQSTKPKNLAKPAATSKTADPYKGAAFIVGEGYKKPKVGSGKKAMIGRKGPQKAMRYKPQVKPKK